MPGISSLPGTWRELRFLFDESQCLCVAACDEQEWELQASWALGRVGETRRWAARRLRLGTGYADLGGGCRMPLPVIPSRWKSRQRLLRNNLGPMDSPGT